MNTFKLFGNPDHWIGQRQLALRGYFHFAKYGLLSTDPEARAKAKLFLQFIPRYTMVGMPLLFWYHQLAGEVVKNSIPGDLVECGTWNGGSAAIMAAALQAKADTRNIRLFDSFRGLPEPTSEDGTLVNRHFFPENCKGDADKVREAFNLIGYDERLIHPAGY